MMRRNRSTWKVSKKMHFPLHSVDLLIPQILLQIENFKQCFLKKKSSCDMPRIVSREEKG